MVFEARRELTSKVSTVPSLGCILTKLKGWKRAKISQLSVSFWISFG
jgi:hypothetical protein